MYGPLFFGFTAHFKDEIKNIPQSVEALIIRMDRVPYIDQSGLYALENAVLDLRQRNVLVLLIDVDEQPCDKLKSIDIIPDLIPNEHIFKTVGEGFNYLKNHLKKIN